MLAEADLAKLIRLAGSIPTLSGNSVFANATIPRLVEVSFKNLMSVTGSDTFAYAQMQSVVRIDLPKVTEISGDNTFKGANLSKLKGIALSKTTTFTVSSFGVTEGPGDIMQLKGKTNSDLIYVNGYYGYRAPIIPFVPQIKGGSVNIFGDASLYQRSTPTTIISVNGITAPATIGKTIIASDGTITGKGSHRLQILFADNNSQHVGAMTIVIRGE